MVGGGGIFWSGGGFGVVRVVRMGMVFVWCIEGLKRGLIGGSSWVGWKVNRGEGVMRRVFLRIVLVGRLWLWCERGVMGVVLFLYKFGYGIWWWFGWVWCEFLFIFDGYL